MPPPLLTCPPASEERVSRQRAAGLGRCMGMPTIATHAEALGGSTGEPWLAGLGWAGLSSLAGGNPTTKTLLWKCREVGCKGRPNATRPPPIDPYC